MKIFINETIKETLQKVLYGFGFGLGMSFAWKINPIDTPQRWNFNQPEFKNDEFNNDKQIYNIRNAGVGDFQSKLMIIFHSSS